MTRALPLSAAAALALSLSFSAAATAADAPALTGKAAFERLKTLAGTWEGRAMDQTSGPPATVTYRVASNGTVVEETLFPGTSHEMISMYHLVAGDLVLTHYCAIGNQPRMKLDARASSADRLVFAFDGGTNFDPAKDGHVHSGFIEWKGGALHNEWSFWEGGREKGHQAFFISPKK